MHRKVMHVSWPPSQPLAAHPLPPQMPPPLYPSLCECETFNLDFAPTAKHKLPHIVGRYRRIWRGESDTPARRPPDTYEQELAVAGGVKYKLFYWPSSKDWAIGQTACAWSNTACDIVATSLLDQTWTTCPSAFPGKWGISSGGRIGQNSRSQS